MKIEVRPAEPHEVAAFFAGQATEYDLLRVGEHVVAMGGFTNYAGRLWAFLDVHAHETTPRIALVRGLRSALQRRGGPIYVGCQADKFPSAPRLLALIGFTPTDDYVGERKVWVWN